MEKNQAVAYLRKVSRYVESLARELSLLPVFAQHNESELAAESVRKCCRLVDACLKAITYDGDIFASYGSPNEVVPILGKSYKSAHLAAVNEANSFLDFLWFYIDREGQEIRMGEALETAASTAADEITVRASEYIFHRTGFDPQLVNSNWELSREVIIDRLNPDWCEEFKVVHSRIARERATYESECNIPSRSATPGSDTNSDKWYSEDEGLRPVKVYQFGPLIGTQKDLSRWMGEEKKGQGRRVQQMQRSGLVWVCKIHTRLYKVWFRDEKIYATANQKRITEGKKPTIKTGET